MKFEHDPFSADFWILNLNIIHLHFSLTTEIYLNVFLN